MASTKPVALVIGASRGMGRQMAIGLAGEGYTGEMIEGALFTIGGQVTDNEERSHHRSENNIRSRETGILSTRSKFISEHYQHSRQGDTLAWRNRNCHGSKHTFVRISGQIVRQSLNRARSTGCVGLQLWGYLVVFGSQDASQAIQADAGSQY